MRYLNQSERTAVHVVQFLMCLGMLNLVCLVGLIIRLGDLDVQT